MVVLEASAVILVHVAVVFLLSWICFRRCRLARPAIGVMNLLDVAFMLGFIVLIPVLYLYFPPGVMIALLTIAAMSGLYILLEAVMPGRLLAGLVVLLLIAADIWVLDTFGTASAPFFAVNNAVQVLVIVSVTNLWAQSGMKASAVVILGLALMVYDFIFTSVLPFMGDLFDQLQYVPFSPMVAWRTGIGDQWAAIGFGDLAIAAVFPLVMRKAFGKPAGLFALGCALGALIAAAGLAFAGLIMDTFPLMVALGPLMLAQYLLWRGQRGEERTTRAYLQAEP